MEAFVDVVRSINQIGQLDLLQAIKLIDSVELKKEIINERAELIKKDVLTHQENPNILELVAIEPDKSKMYKLHKKIVKEILPPRVIDTEHFDKQELVVIVPPVKKVPKGMRLIQANLIKLLQVEAEQQHKETISFEEKMQRKEAVDTFLKLNRTAVNALEEARELYVEVCRMEKEEKLGNHVDLEQKMDVLQKLKCIAAENAELQVYAPFYEKHYQLQNPKAKPANMTVQAIEADIAEL